LVENFFEVTKYVSLTGHMYLAAALVCGNKALSQLPEDLQAQVREAAAAATQAEREAMDKMAGEALAMLKEKGLEFNEVDSALFREAVSSVYANNADRVGGMDVIDQVAAQ